MQRSRARPSASTFPGCHRRCSRLIQSQEPTLPTNAPAGGVVLVRPSTPCMSWLRLQNTLSFLQMRPLYIQGRTLFVDFEAWKVGCDIDRTPALFAGSDKRWDNPFGWSGIPGAKDWPIIADSSNHGRIHFQPSNSESSNSSSLGSMMPASLAPHSLHSRL